MGVTGRRAGDPSKLKPREAATSQKRRRVEGRSSFARVSS